MNAFHSSRAAPRSGGGAPRPGAAGARPGAAGARTVGLVTGKRVAWAATAAAAAACLWAFLGATITVKSVRISGARYLSPAAIITIAGVKTGARVGPAEGEMIRKELLRTRAFSAVSVVRGLTGTLHIHVREREPVAWSRSYACALAADGTILYRVSRRDASWPALSGLPASEGTAGDPATIADAMKGYGMARGLLDGEGVTWRRSGPSAWVIEAGKKRVTVSSPVREEEYKRLMRFQRGYPDAWARARMLDLRFADRVVVKR